jgi:hypothetical protein
MIPVSLAFYASSFWLGRHNSAGEGYLASLFEDLLSTLLFLPFLASIAVAWHRLLLMNEEWPGSVYLRLDGCVGSYLGLSAVISILFPGTLSVFISGVAAGWHGLLLLGVALATGVGLFLGIRIWLALPARALGNSEIAVRQAWGGSRGNVWRLIAGSFLCGVPMVMLVVLAAVFGPDLAEARQPLVYAAWQTLFEIGLTFLAGMPIVSFLSLAYRYLIQDRELLLASRLQAYESTR